MGISSGSSSTKPVYNRQIEGAANTMTGAYNANAPQIQSAADQIGGLLPSLIGRARDGDAGLDAARGYITQTLGSERGSNPHLQGMIDQTNQSVADRTKASLGTRGLTGGSVMADMMSRAMLDNETGLRYRDYDAEEMRRANAAAMASGVSGATDNLVNPAMNAAGATMMPVQAAAANAAGVGGLLGQYTNTRTSQPWGGMLLGALSGGANAIFGGRG